MQRFVTAIAILLIIISAGALITNSTITGAQKLSLIAAGQPPPGCNGDIKTHDGNGEPDPVQKDEPKVCSFHLHGFNFDPGTEVDWRIETQPGDPGQGGTEVLFGSLTVGDNGEIRTEEFHLPNGMYKVYWHQAGCPGGEKHKVFKVECPLPTPTPVQPTPTPTTQPGVTPTVPPTATPTEGPSPTATPTQMPPTATPTTPTGVTPTPVQPTPTPTTQPGVPTATPPVVTTPTPLPPGPGRIKVGKWLWHLDTQIQTPEVGRTFTTGTTVVQTGADGRGEFILSKGTYKVTLDRPTSDPFYVRCFIEPVKNLPGYWVEFKPWETVEVTFNNLDEEGRMECVNIPPQLVPQTPPIVMISPTPVPPTETPTPPTVTPTPPMPSRLPTTGDPMGLPILPFGGLGGALAALGWIIRRAFKA
ncbi:MAG: hypothetical protein Q8P89_00885 [bacterium]|nr:hypothetical protein [bacterium]